MDYKLEALPKGWSMQQCGTCHMVFALPPIKGDSSRVLANGRLINELTRHRQAVHSKEDVNQAAARTVKNLTEGK